MQITGKVLAFLFLLVVLVLIFTIPTMLLWNWLAPDLFGLKTITFWQAMGLCALSHILFKSTSSKNA